jgi:hypothetical protein
MVRQVVSRYSSAGSAREEFRDTTFFRLSDPPWIASDAASCASKPNLPFQFFYGSIDLLNTAQYLRRQWSCRQYVDSAQNSAPYAAVVVLMCGTY